MNIETVKKDIESWLINFVEVPHPSLGGWSPCPYARRARLENKYNVLLGSNPYEDLVNISYSGLGGFEVLILAYDAAGWDHILFGQMIKSVNENYLINKDIIALEDHPADVEIVNGVCMNQGKYALILVQQLSELNLKAQLLAKQGFYNSWPEQYLQSVLQHRKDPRT